RARQLAAEVERWLADEPVSADREPVGERLRRWGKRHRTLVSSLAVLLVATVVGLSGGLYAVGQEEVRTREQRDVAWQNEQLALQREGEAKSNLARARKAEGTAKTNLKL